MNTETNKFTIPLAIVVAGVLIAGAIFFGGNRSGVSLTPKSSSEVTGDVAKVTSTDHILGNLDAKVIVIEYSDFECPFCKVFHNTMHQIMNTYKPGEVAWVYRQFPLYQGSASRPPLHSKAGKESEASECAAAQGGNMAFWKFADRIFEITPSNNGLDAGELPNIAKFIGIDVPLFNTCLSTGQFTKTIENAVTAAGKAGAEGTPYSVVMNQSGKKTAIVGAQPFEKVKAAIDALLK